MYPPLENYNASDPSNLVSPLLEPPQRTRRGCLARPYRCVRDFFMLIPASMQRFFSSTRASLTSFFISMWNLVKQDRDKTIHSFKMGLALSLAFLLVLLKAPYTIIGSHAIWAIMTVVVVFEFTMGATLNKGYNRGAGTLAAGLLAIVLGQGARLSGHIAYPLIVGVGIFVAGGVVTFIRLWPSLKQYEFGFRTFLLTFCLIMAAEYRQDDPVNTAVNRFLIILMGAGIGLSVNLFVFPLWAGELLHESLVQNFASVADSLEACVDEYLRGTILERVPSKIFMGLAADDPVYKGYRNALVSASKEETLASFAMWEPPHGRFKMFRYPWMQYQRVGAILRHCTYSVVALHGCLRSAIQAPVPVRLLFEKELREVGIEGAKVLRKLGKQVENMQKGGRTRILDGVLHAVERLQQSLYLNSFLLIKDEMGHESDMPDNLSITVLPELKKFGSHEHHNGFFRNGSFHKMGIVYSHDDMSIPTNGRCFRKLNSWPYRPIDDFEFAKDSVLEQRVRVLESASALSLGTFATLLMEVALRLDYVVEAVDELADLAEWRPEEDPKSEQATQIVAM